MMNRGTSIRKRKYSEKFLKYGFTFIVIGVGSGGSGGSTGPPACKISGNLSKCLYILPEKFVTAITSPKKKDHQMFGLTFGDRFRPKMMEKVQRNRL